MTGVACPARLELPRDLWVICDLGAGHEGKHSGAPGNGDRYWWVATYARARRLVPKGAQNASLN